MTRIKQPFIYSIRLHRAEDAIDKVIDTIPSLRRFSSVPCETLSTKLIGHQGYSVNLERILIQQYAVSRAVAHRLARAYGGRAHDVLKIALETDHLDQRKSNNRFNLLVPGYPIIEAEVIFSVRHDWAVHAEDILARRTRLAFLNKESALQAIPRIVELMSEELGWTHEKQNQESQKCLEYLSHFGGSVSATHDTASSAADVVRLATMQELAAIFKKVDGAQSGSIGRREIERAAGLLNKPLTDEELSDCITFGIKFDQKEQGGTYDGMNPPEDTSQDGAGGERISLEAFSAWWNSERFNPKLVAMKATKMTMTNMSKVVGSGTLFG